MADERNVVRGLITPQVYEELFADYDLHTVEGIHFVVPKGTLVFTGANISAIVRQITEHAEQAEREDG